jgi:hypothetical protein
LRPACDESAAYRAISGNTGASISGLSVEAPILFRLSAQAKLFDILNHSHILRRYQNSHDAAGGKMGFNRLPKNYT